METHNQENPTLKRQRGGNDEIEQRKSQRLAASPAEQDDTTKIINLIDDCLVKIFEYLDVQSLLNVAIANEWLRPAARDVYKRKFGEKQVVLSGCDDFQVNSQNTDGIEIETPYLTEDECCDEIKISGLKRCLLYLRCFGPSITKLWIDYNKSMSKRYGYVHQYINGYCADSLICITFDCMPNIAIHEFQKVFAHVEKVAVYDSDLEEQWPSFVKSFPNLRCLEIDEVNIGHCVCVGIEKPFEYLEHLEIHGCNTHTTSQLATGLLQGIRQLKSLQMVRINDDDLNVPISALMCMIEANPSITKLVYSFNGFKRTSANLADVQRIVTEHAALTELRLEDYLFRAADAIALIRQLHSLTEFQFQLENSQRNALVPQLIRKWKINYRNWIDIDHTWVTLKRKM